MFLEVRSMYKRKLGYFNSFWNNLTLISLILNIGFAFCDLGEVDVSRTRALGSVCVWIMWCKLFYYLRLFRTTAPLVRIIMQIIKDMSIFSFVFTLAIFGFGNTFYILSHNGIDVANCSDEMLINASD